MNDIKLIELLINKIKVNQTDESLYKDCFSLIVNYENIKEVLIYSNQLREICYKAIVNNPNISVSISDIASKLLLFEAPHLFDSYMLYLESGRRPAERFYLPRRKRLKPLVDALQELQDDKLDELFLSMPPRVGKTSILLFYVTWIIGKDSEHSNLYSAYSDTITKKFYDGILEILNDNYTYKWKEIFPKSKLVDTNSRDETLNIDRKKRYPSVTCRSLYGTLNGACDCNGTLISDDLIGGIEEALNPDRLAAAWSKVDNNLVTRAKQNAKILWCGTRWSMVDPAGIRMGLLENDMTFKNRRYRIINVPAMNNEDESNFDYLYGVGFSTEYYKQRRASFERNNDMASWCAQYMGEPIERNGALFTPEDMRYYNGVLPKGTPDRIFLACDVAFGGGDYVSAPVAYQFDEEVYIHDVVFDSGDKYITRPRVIDLIKKNNVRTARFEKNNGGEDYKEYVEAELRKKKYRLNITSKSAPTNKRKEMRIFEKAPEIREFYFIETGKRSKDYNLFMQNLFSFKITGNNKNDDAPDSLAMLADMVGSTKKNYEIIRRII